MGALDQRGGIISDSTKAIGMDEAGIPGKVERKSRQGPGSVIWEPR